MNLKRSLILLLVAAVISRAAADLKTNVISAIKEKAKARVLCPTKYSAYVNNCTANFDSGIRKCVEEEETELLNLNETSEKSREKLELEADNSCQAVIECDDRGDDISGIYDCILQQSQKSSTSIKNTSYKASVLHLNYDRKMLAMEEKLNKCTNVTTEELDEKTNAALDALTACFRTGKWELVELTPVAAELMPTPAVLPLAENPTDSATTKETVRQTRVSKTTEEAAQIEPEKKAIKEL